MLPQTTYEMRMSAKTEKATYYYPQHQHVNIMKSSSSSQSCTTTTTTSTSTSKKNNKKQQKKKVQFYAKVKLWCIPYRSEEDYEAIWYDQDDYARFKADSRKTIAMAIQRRCLGHSGYHYADDGTLLSVIPTTTTTSIITNEVEEEESLCTRGLEHFICHERKQLRYHRRRKSIEVVWEEQVRQWDTKNNGNSLHDHQRIADMYSKVCVISRMNATMQGYSYYVENLFHDHRELLLEQQDDETNCNNNNNNNNSKLFPRCHLLDGSPPSSQKTTRKKQVTTPLA